MEFLVAFCLEEVASRAYDAPHFEAVFHSNKSAEPICVLVRQGMVPGFMYKAP